MVATVMAATGQEWMDAIIFGVICLHGNTTTIKEIVDDTIWLLSDECPSAIHLIDSYLETLHTVPMRAYTS